MRTRRLDRIRPLFALLPAALFALPSLSQPAVSPAGKRPFALEDLYRLKTVADPAVSPDGNIILYTVATSDYAAAKKTIALWPMDADGRNARPLTFSDAK